MLFNGDQSFIQKAISNQLGKNLHKIGGNLKDAFKRHKMLTFPPMVAFTCRLKAIVDVSIVSWAKP